MPLSRRLALVASLALVAIPLRAASDEVTVFAAASLTEAMTEAGLEFQQSHGIAVRFSFASSSTLARQVEAGAPAGLVALASEDWADYLADRGAILTETRISAVGNRLVLIAPSEGSPTLSAPPDTPIFPR